MLEIAFYYIYYKTNSQKEYFLVINNKNMIQLRKDLKV